MADISVITEVLGQRELQELDRTLLKLGKSTNQFSDRLEYLDSRQKKNLGSVRQTISFSQRMVKQRERETKEAMRSLDAQRKANQQIVSSYQRIKAAADPLYASEMRLKEAQRSVITAYQQGNITRREAVETMRQYRAAVQNGTLAGQGLNKGMNRMGVLFQQTGYQVGDFAVQVQSGTHMMVALGQQATQLVGTLGMLAKSTKMIALFSGLGIVVPILTAVAGGFMRAAEKSNEAAESVGDFTSAIKEYEKFSSQAGKTTAELAEEFGNFADEVKRTSGLLANVAVSRAFDNLNTGTLRETQESLGEISDQFKDYQKALEKTEKNLDEYSTASQKAFAQDTIRIAKEELDSLAETFGILPEQAAQFDSMLSELNASDDLVQVRDRSQAILDFFSEIFSEGQKIPGPIADALAELEKMRSAAARATAEVEGAKDEAQLLKDIASDIDFSAASASARALAKELGIAVSLATRLDPLARQQRAETTPLGSTGTVTAQGVELGLYDEYEKARKEAEKAASQSSGGGGTSKTQVDEAQKALDKLREQLELEEVLIGKSEERKRIIKALGIEFVQQNPEIVSGLEDQITKIDEMTQRENQIKKLGETIKSSLGDAFMSIVDGSKSAGDAFKDMARLVLKQAFELLVIKPILDGLFGGQGSSGGGLLGKAASALFSANGNAFEQGGKLTAYADGGVVTAPTGFAHSGGLGVMGEAGPEAIMPLKRGKNGKLGVQTEGGSQQPVVIHQNFNFSANGDDSVKRIIAQEAPKIAQMTQKQVLDQRARGGAFRTTFGG